MPWKQFLSAEGPFLPQAQYRTRGPPRMGGPLVLPVLICTQSGWV